MVLFTIIFIPLLFTAMPLIMLSVMGSTMSGATSSSSSDVPEAFLAVCGSMSGSDCMQVYLINEFLILFMLMPVIIPITIAAYSVVGEKTTRSLEPLLATPVTTEELLAGKSLAAALPAIVATWASFFIFVLLIPVTGASQMVRQYVIGPTWLTGVLLIGPLMAIAAVNFAIMVSSRVNDPRVAEQLSAVIIVPILGLMFAQIAGVIVINQRLILLVAGGFVLADFALIFLGARLFQRETILNSLEVNHEHQEIHLITHFHLRRPGRTAPQPGSVFPCPGPGGL